MKFFYMVISHYNNHTTNNTLFKKIESHEKVIPIYELGNAYYPVVPMKISSNVIPRHFHKV